MPTKSQPLSQEKPYAPK
uniref:Uncharacterized protein n=1 Tax=Arundo donax TaxID=35708 RepID=A0A0A9BND7_ARUDO